LLFLGNLSTFINTFLNIRLGLGLYIREHVTTIHYFKLWKIEDRKVFLYHTFDILPIAIHISTSVQRIVSTLSWEIKSIYK
jgi:hypothetical protein